MFFTASGRPDVASEVALFVEAVQESTLPAADVARDQVPTTWDAALRLLVAALPTDRPGVVVLDELPYLVAGDPGFEGTLQKTSTGNSPGSPCSSSASDPTWR